MLRTELFARPRHVHCPGDSLLRVVLSHNRHLHHYFSRFVWAFGVVLAGRAGLGSSGTGGVGGIATAPSVSPLRGYVRAYRAHDP